MYHTYRDYRFTASDAYTMMLNQYQAMIDLLESHRPSRICELGCGQSTVILEQYCDRYQATLSSIEDDEIFFHKNTTLLPVIEYTRLDIQDKSFGDCNLYKGLEDWLSAQDPFDFIVIDGPKGYGFREGYRYGRIQLLSFLLLGKICSSSVVLMHDSERANIAATLNEFERLLPEIGFGFQRKNLVSSSPPNCSQLTIYQLIGVHS